MKSEQNQVIFRKDYQQPNYWVKSVSLGFLIEPTFTMVRSKIQFNHNTTKQNRLVLNGVDIDLMKISIDGRVLDKSDYVIDDESLTIDNTPENFVLQVENKIYPSKNTALEGLYQSGDFFLTQCEAEGFRKITYYPDRPDVMAPFEVTLIANKVQGIVLC